MRISGTTGSAHGSSKSETFWMASLKTPIAEKNFTDAEKEAGKRCICKFRIQSY